MGKFLYKSFRRIAGVAGAAAILLFSSIIYYNNAIPNNFYVSEGKNLTLTNYSFIKEASAVAGTSLADASTGTENTIQLNLFGVIPVKSTHINSVNRPVVTPGGTPFGIKLYTNGVMVIDVGNVDTQEGTLCPARLCGIKKGDIILSVNGESVSSNEDIQEIIEESKGNSLPVIYEREGKKTKTMLKPVVSNADGKYKSGVWVRDSSAGIGTITYYDPSTGKFGGLGHGICDVDTGEIMPLSSGEVCEVSINSVIKGQAGSPGELRGSFASNVPCGYLELNNEAGVFGKLVNMPNNLTSIPIKLKQEVKTGKASILCTLDNSGIHEYSINIDKVDLNPQQLTKNMLITVTDPVLLGKTGGIVQGMSGSPILQDGRLIGAVTHVFVNNPKKGYGIFAENMLNYQ